MVVKNTKDEKVLSVKKNKYENDLDRLIELGQNLQQWYLNYCNDTIPEEQRNISWNNFFLKYQTWYSESISLIKICLPDRLNEFKSLYEKQSKRKEISCENYVIEDALDGLTAWRTKVEPKCAIIKFQRQLTILYSIKQTFKSSLFSLKTMLQADLFDDDIMAAKSLNQNGFVRAAGAMCGVVIEKHLSEICQNHALKVNRNNPTIHDFNDLLKSNDIYKISYFRKIQYLADIRNKCDHNKKEEPTKEEVNELIDGTSWLIKNVF